MMESQDMFGYTMGGADKCAARFAKLKNQLLLQEAAYMSKGLADMRIPWPTTSQTSKVQVRISTFVEQETAECVSMLYVYADGALKLANLGELPERGKPLLNAYQLGVYVRPTLWERVKRWWWLR